MSIIEDRILAMKFDNKQFEAGVKVTMGTLNLLKNSLNFGGSAKGLDEVQASVNRFSMAGMGTGVDAITAKFSALGVMAITTLTNITNRAVDAGMNMAKSLTIDPITQGLQEYETNMNSIQTILANTQASGATLKDVTGNLDELNHYADQTIYNFSEMARNIGTFTAAGVDLDTSTQSIKGIANLAALSGSNSQQASSAMYQLSQAISAGRVSLEDWNSVVNAGMGGTVFQRALAQTAEQMGTLSAGAVQLEGDMKNVTIGGKSFRESVTAKPGEESWLTSEVLTETLKQFTGDLTDAELAAQGFNEEQIRAIQTQALTAKNAATEVKTFTQLIDTLKEGVGSGWAETWRILIGDFEEAKTLWTAVSNTVGGMLGKTADARNELLGLWAGMGGRQDIIDSLTNVFNLLVSIVKPIGDAFREIFPPITVMQLTKMSMAIKEFTAGLSVSGETANNIKRTFAGVFAIFGIGWEVVKALFGVFAQLFGVVQNGSGGILEFTASIGDWLVAVHKAVQNGTFLNRAMEVLGGVLSLPIRLLQGMGSILSGVVSGMQNLGEVARVVWGILARGDFQGGIWEEDSAVVNVLFTIREALEAVGSAANQLWNIFAKGDFVSGVFSEDSALVDGLMTIREAFAQFFTPGSIAGFLGVGAAGAIALALRNVIKNGISFGVKGSDGVFESLIGMFDGIKGTFEGVTDLFGSLTGALTTMQNDIKANIILKIAIAVGILAGSMKMLSTIDGGDLAKALGAVTAAMLQLMGAMAILAKISGAAGFLAIPTIANAMVSLSIAVLILATAVKSLSSLSWGELIKGLAGVAGVLVTVVAAAWGLSKVQGSILRTSIALIPMALALKILASAVADFGAMSWDVMIRGLVGVTAALIGIAGALRLMPKTMVSTGAGLVLVGVGLNVIAKAVSSFGAMDWNTLIRGIGSIAAALVLIAGALRLMPGNLLTMSVGLSLVSLALLGISQVVTTLGGMGWGDMIQGLVGLGGALGILATALTFMNTTLAGSAALIIASAAIGMLVPQLIVLSMLSFGELLMGLIGLAGALTVIGIAGALITPVVPTLLGLGAALALLGIGLGSIGLGAQAFVAALSAMVSLVDKSKLSLIGLMDLIPLMAARLAEGIISFATTIASNATTFVGAFKGLILALLDAIIEIAPRIGEALSTMLQTFLNIIITNAPMIALAFTAIIQSFLLTIQANAPGIINTIFSVMMSFLQTIRDRIPEIVTAATDIIVNFINAIANNLPRIVESGFNLIITFIESLATSVRNNTERMRQAGWDLATAIVDGMTGGLATAVGRVATKAAEMARGALNAAKEALGINSPSKEFIAIGEFSGEGLVVGLDNTARDVRIAGRNMADGLLYSINERLRPGVEGVQRMFGDIGSAANQMLGVVTTGEFTNGSLVEDSPIIRGLFDMREGFIDVARVGENFWSMLSRGEFIGDRWTPEDHPVVETLLNLHNGFKNISKSAEQAGQIISNGDFINGPWVEDSPIVKGLFHIREAIGPDLIERFKTVGKNIMDGLNGGIVNGHRDWVEHVGKLGTDALNHIKAVLGIHSPSREFEKVGEYTVDGLVKGVDNGKKKVEKSGINLATGLFSGFSKGVGTQMPKVLESVFKTLETGAADARFWGPNSPATLDLLNMHNTLVDLELQMASFYGEVNLADPASIEEYAEKAGDSLKHLSGLFDGLKSAATKAFGMLAEGEGLDAVLGSTDVLSALLNGVLSLLPGVQGAAISLGLAVVDGLLSVFLGPGTSLIGIVGDFLSGAVRTVAGWLGIKLPIKEDVKEGEEAVEDFLVTVEGGTERFQKLAETGIDALAKTLSNADALLEMKNDPVITPVLDLTQFNKDKSTMLNGLDPNVAISPTTSASQASGVYNMQQDLKQIQAETTTAAPSTTIEYNQYNNSPKALNHVEIYRQTKSQLSLTKEALNVG